jgi:hypothetical protein
MFSFFDSAVTISTGKCEVRHVPVGNDELETAATQTRETGRAVLGFIDVRKTQFLQQVSHDTAHRREVIDDQNLHVLVHLHCSLYSRCFFRRRARRTSIRIG